MNSLRWLGVTIVALGLVLCVFPFVTGGSTMRGCSDMGYFYETFGIAPEKYHATVYPFQLAVGWTDGCNTHSSSLIPTIIGTGGVATGVVVARRSGDDD